MDEAVLAVGAHPDDIEFMMAGTLALLKNVGAEVHMWSLTDGSLGSLTMDPDRTARVRMEEGCESAGVLGAALYPPVSRDMELSASRSARAAVTSVVRRVMPRLILAPAPEDYHPDHVAASAIVVAAALARGLPGFETDPREAPWEGDLAIYHALPHGLLDPLGRRVKADRYVDISSVVRVKREMLEAHKSQRELLMHLHGNDPISIMEDMAEVVGSDSGRFALAEGWRLHAHTGLSRNAADPMLDLLEGACFVERHQEWVSGK